MAQTEKIVFIGGRDRGLECLKTLIKAGENIAYIFCMPEDKHERKKYYEEIKDLADKEKIPIKITKSIKSVEDFKILKSIQPHLMIVMGWRTIVPKEILSLPKRGTVAAHESLLPKGRGFAPINWSVLNGDKKTGVTLFYLEEGVDEGDIVDQKIIPINNKDTAWDIYLKAKIISVELLMKHIKALKKGTASRRKQNKKLATYYPARVPEDGKINWSWETKKIYNLIRALSDPYPGACTYYKDQKIIIQKALIPKDFLKFAGNIPGRVGNFVEKGVDVITGDGVLRIEEIELEDGQRLPARDFITSIKGTLI